MKTKVIYTLIFILINTFAGFTQNMQKIDSLQKVLTVAISNNDSTNITINYYLIAQQYKTVEKKNLALEYYNKALVNAKLKQQAKILNQIGNVYAVKAELKKAISFYIKSLKISEKTANKKSQAISLNNIGFVYFQYNKLEKALEYYKKALKIRLEINHTKGIGYSYSKLGSVYYEMDSLDKALKFTKKAFKIFEQINNQFYKSNTINNIGNIYLKKNNISLALEYHLEAKKIREEINDYRGIAESLKNLVKIYIKQNNFVKAEQLSKEGILLTEEYDLIQIQMNFHKQLYVIQAKTKKYEQALESYINYSTLKDSIFNIESNKNIEELEYQYQTEKKEQKIKLLSLKNKLNIAKIIKQRNQLVFFILGAIIFLISFLIVLLIYIQKNKAFKMLVKQNVEITKLEQLQEKQINNKNSINTKHEITLEKNIISKEKEILKNLEIKIVQKKYYLNPVCNIENLAKQINTNRQYLSQIINENYKTNFNNFINSFRIKEARKLLLEPKNNKYTLEAIGEKSGFKNRASFNTAFKKFTGVTPSFFKKEQK